jgi:acyl-CoA synthetase (AMP-forming)/AMP-acid ligase II/acyl carrier protein
MSFPPNVMETGTADESPDTLFKLARHRANAHPDMVGYTFLTDGETAAETLTYGELDVRARAIAGRIQTACRPGDHALLVYGPGLDYIVALFACQYAGVIPVPAYPPDPLRSARTLSRLQAIAGDCRAVLALGTNEHLGWTGSLLKDQLGLRESLATERWQEWVGLPWTPPETNADQVALLQYTSGSTATPRGVMVTHRNLWFEFEGMRVADSEHSAGVSWLPLYHDLGLIGGALTPIYFRRPVVLMSPLAFVQRPHRWLQALSRYRAPITGAPNFAFDLCVSKFSAEEASGLDLSALQVILTGAEPVRADTLDRFTATYAAYGLSPDVWRPCFGLAEATLGVTGVTAGSQVTRVAFSLRELERNRAVPATRPGEPSRCLVGCGHALPGSEVRVVNPTSRLALPDGQVGELWVQGPNVARGYWNRPAETEVVFRAHLADSGRGPFLRTGDLGFHYQGQFYLTGRLKEVMVFWGRNVYPQDVEMTAWSCHPSLKQNACAAFAYEAGGIERLAIVQEVARPGKLDLDAIASSVRQAVQSEHQVPLSALVFIKPGTLLKTSSGKVQRNLVRDRFLANELTVIREWRFQRETETARSQVPAGPPRLCTPEEIRQWLLERIARHCNVGVEQIDTEEPINRYVLDSVSAVMIATELQDWLGRAVSPVVLYDSPTLGVLAGRLADPEACAAAATSLPPAVEELSPRELDDVLVRLLNDPMTPTTNGGQPR